MLFIQVLRHLNSVPIKYNRNLKSAQFYIQRGKKQLMLAEN